MDKQKIILHVEENVLLYDNIQGKRIQKWVQTFLFKNLYELYKLNLLDEIIVFILIN